jgi:uncharacterized membrane protein YkvA (DUF1232 family)
MTTPPPKTEQQYLDFYQKLRAKVRRSLEKRRKESSPGTRTAYERLVEYLALLPDFFHLVVKLMFDPVVPARKKALLGVMAAYIFNPIDIIPDIVPVVGYLDDLVVLALGLNQVFSGASDELKAAARRHWAGDGDVFDAIDSVVATANAAVRFLPKQFMSLVRAVLRGCAPKDADGD